MPSFQEFINKRQEQNNSAHNTIGPNYRPKTQATSNQAQQPQYTENDGPRSNLKLPMGDSQFGPSGPTEGGSSVNSSGRIAAGGAPPLWQQQQATVGNNNFTPEQIQARQGFQASIAALGPGGGQSYGHESSVDNANSWRQQEYAQSQRPGTSPQDYNQWMQGQQQVDKGGQPWQNQASYNHPVSQFDPNNFHPVTTDQSQKDYWNFAMQQQQGLPQGQDFFSTLQAGTPVSGSPNSVWQQNPQGQWGTATVPQGNQPPQVPNQLPQYNPTQYAQYNTPNNQHLEQGGNDLVSYLMQNPESMDANTVAQMKEGQKDASSDIQRQLQEAILSDHAARGLSGGGTEHAALAQNNQSFASNLLKGYRDTDINANATNRQDVINALSGGNNFLTGQTGRASSNYANTLQGQQMTDASSRFGATFGQGQVKDIWDLLSNNYNTTNQNEQNNLTRALQEKLGMAGVGVDQGRLAESSRQFDKMFPLNAAQILGNLGLGFGNLDLNRDQFNSDDQYRGIATWLKANGYNI